MHDNVYREFIIGVLTYLEPISEEKGTILQAEIEEVYMIRFISKGKVGLGHEVNKVRKVHFVYKNHCVVGAFETLFNQRSSYIYVAITNCHGYFIRKEHINEVLDLSHDIS